LASYVSLVCEMILQAYEVYAVVKVQN